MDNSNLSALLTKITYRMPWEEWGLTGEDFDLIELATTEEIADIVYKKGLKVATLIQNSDYLVDEYNERIHKKMVRDLKNLKLDLYSDLPRAKKVKPSPPDPDEAERRLMEETITEIVDFAPIDPGNKAEEDDWIDFDIEERCKQLGLVPEYGFRPVIEMESPSLHRDVDPNVVHPSRISLYDPVPYEMNAEQFASGEGFGEANMEQIAESGIFDTANGRQIYNSLNNRKSMAEVGEIVTQRRAAHSSIMSVPEIHITDKVNPAAVPDVSAHEASSIDVPLNREIPSAALNQMDDIEVSGIDPVHPQGVDEAVVLVGKSNRISRREMFDKIATEAVAQETPRRRRRRRLIRRSPTPLRIEQGDFLELNGPLIRHKRRSKKGGPYKPEAPLHVILDIFEDLSDFEPDREPYRNESDEEELMEVEIQPVPQQTHEESGSVLRNHQRQSSIQVPSHTSVCQEEKRLPLEEDIRVVIGFDENLPSPSARELPTPLPVAALVADVSETPIAPPRLPSISFHPQTTSTAQKAHAAENRLTVDDVEFARYQEISKENLNPNRSVSVDIEALVNQLDRSKRIPRLIAIEPSEQVTDKTPLRPQSPPRVRKYVSKDGENMIALRNDDGSQGTYVEYNMETMFLYLQIRMMMKSAGRWKMKLSELMPRLQLSKPVKELIIEMRIRLLADCGFFILTFTRDEEHVDEVEIKINPALSVEGQ